MKKKDAINILSMVVILIRVLVSVLSLFSSLFEFIFFCLIKLYIRLIKIIVEANINLFFVNIGQSLLL